MKDGALRILFVENHAVFARTVSEEFLAGFEVTVVPSLAEARRQIATEAFQAILVDFDLDDGKGDALVAELRAQGFAGRVIAVSARDEGNAKLAAAGADAICPKARFHEIHRALSRVRSGDGQ